MGEVSSDMVDFILSTSNDPHHQPIAMFADQVRHSAAITARVRPACAPRPARACASH